MRLRVVLLTAAVLGSGPVEAAAFEVVGHRGSRGLRPENTLAAVFEAVKVGVTTVEVDVVLTKDRHVVVRHDLRVSSVVCRGPYQRRFYKNLTLAQVRRLDCGTRRASDELARTQVAVPGSHVPTLAQIYRATPRRVRVLVDVKTNPRAPRETLPERQVARRVVKTIRGSRGARRTTVQAFDWGVLRTIGRMAPRLRLQGLASERTMYPGSPWLGGVHVRPDPFRSGLASAAQRAGFDGLSVPGAKATPKLVYSAHQRGLALLPYTIDAPEEMRELIARGVDGIITDYPDRLRQVARSAGKRIGH